MKKVLIANAKSATSLAVIRSLGLKGIEITGATDSTYDIPLVSKFCRHKIFLKTDHLDTDDRISELLDIVRLHQFDVFMPVMSETLLRPLSKLKYEFEKFTKLPIPDFETFNYFDDKSETTKLQIKNNIPCPKTYILDNDEEINSIIDKADYPLVIKPFMGEGAEGIRFITHPEDVITEYRKIKEVHGPCIIQEFVPGEKYTAVFLLDAESMPKRFFVHRAIREYPISGGPTCFLESVKYDKIFDIGVNLLRSVNFFGLASMEFIVDERDDVPKIIDVNPRFYGPLQCAISAGADFPYALLLLAVNGNIDVDFTYQAGIRCRNLLFEDTKHLISVWRGVKSPKYKIGKIQTLVNYLNFCRDDSYFILSLSDPKPAILKLYNLIRTTESIQSNNR